MSSWHFFFSGYLAFWDVDNYYAWLGHGADMNWLTNITTFASTGQMPFCAWPTSYMSPDWTHHTTSSFTETIYDAQAYVNPVALFIMPI